MSRVAWTFVACAVTLACLPERASACSCVERGELCQAFWSADGTPADVFEATVTSVEEVTLTARNAGQHPELIDSKRIVAHLADVRGRLGRTTSTVFTGLDTCRFHFEVGRRYLFHTRITAVGASVHTCSYSTTIESAGPILAFLDSLDRDTSGGTISGTVSLRNELFAVDRRNRSLAGIRVSLRGAATRDAVSAADGRFRFDALPPGEYVVDVEEDEARALVPVGSADFVLAHTRACVDLPMKMAFTSLVEGTLQDREGRRLRGMAVELRAADLVGTRVHSGDADGRGEPAPLAPIDSLQDLTANSGRFAFRNVPPGRYVVGVNLEADADDGPLAPQYLTDRTGQPMILTLGPGTHHSVGALTLSHARVPLTGTVVTADARAVAGASVHASAMDGDSWRPETIYATADAEGRFTLWLAPGKRYQVEAGKDTLRASSTEVDAGSGPLRIVIGRGGG
ncbi:MAG: carboxypeptidase-like regulatory domain-containing protein [Vicinamibacterales bacterium]